MRHLYVDMDGVVADFNGHYAATFGVTPSYKRDNVDWDLVNTTPTFFADLPPMADMMELWDGIKHLHPIMLTGVPDSVPTADRVKRDWIARNLGGGVPVITCRSVNKSYYAHPGDILIDDWEKHMALWLDKGGIWITHTSAVDTLRQLTAMGILKP